MLWLGIGIGSIFGFLVFWTAREEAPAARGEIRGAQHPAEGVPQAVRGTPSPNQ
jgi:hypothetical protein